MGQTRLDRDFDTVVCRETSCIGISLTGKGFPGEILTISQKLTAVSTSLED